ncbi:NAD-dependent epimerase/dehydratase family protein [Flavobacterium sp.]|uniref:NAD-dependent epimerase/dehydratase family protein n=1 Tax=Flavobacterium sp. TaxID=239 RepID=UPI0038FCD3B8
MVLVTGVTGLVGSHLALQLLENNVCVRAIYRTTASMEKTKSIFRLYKKESLFEKIEWIQADITDVPSLEVAFKNIEYVYHCAALISFDPKDEKQIRKINIEGTANVVNFCLGYGIKKLCHVSSIAALGDVKENENQISEESEWNPELHHSDYAISKYGAEMEIWRGQQEGLETIVLNPGVIIGPFVKLRDWNQGSGLLFEKVTNGFPFYSKGTTGFIAVDDVIQIMIHLMKTEISNERFILVGQNIVFKELLDTIADALQVKRPYIHANPFLINIAYKIDWLIATVFGRKRKLNRSIVMASYGKNLYSNKKLKSALGFECIAIHGYIKKISAL